MSRLPLIQPGMEVVCVSPVNGLFLNGRYRVTGFAMDMFFFHPCLTVDPIDVPGPTDRAGYFPFRFVPAAVV